MSEKRKIQRFNLDEGRIWEAIEGLSPYKTIYTFEEICEKLNEQQAIIERLKKDNEKLCQLIDVSMKADEVFSVFDDLKYIESSLTFLIDNGLEEECVEYEREDIHFVAERLKIVLKSLDDD